MIEPNETFYLLELICLDNNINPNVISFDDNGYPIGLDLSNYENIEGSTDFNTKVDLIALDPSSFSGQQTFLYNRLRIEHYKKIRDDVYGENEVIIVDIDSIEKKPFEKDIVHEVLLDKINEFTHIPLTKEFTNLTQLDVNVYKLDANKDNPAYTGSVLYIVDVVYTFDED